MWWQTWIKGRESIKNSAAGRQKHVDLLLWFSLLMFFISLLWHRNKTGENLTPSLDLSPWDLSPIFAGKLVGRGEENLLLLSEVTGNESSPVIQAFLVPKTSDCHSQSIAPVSGNPGISKQPHFHNFFATPYFWKQFIACYELCVLPAE